MFVIERCDEMQEYSSGLPEDASENLLEETDESDKLFGYDYEPATEIYPDVSIKVEREYYSLFEIRRKHKKKEVILDPELT